MRLDRAGKRHAGEKRLVRFLRLTLEALRNRNTERFCQRGNGSLVIEKRQLRRCRGAKPRDGVDFFPLSVDYEEKLYAVGKIPGGFLKRERRPPRRLS